MRAKDNLAKTVVCSRSIYTALIADEGQQGAQVSGWHAERRWDPGKVLRPESVTVTGL